MEQGLGRKNAETGRFFLYYNDDSGTVLLPAVTQGSSGLVVVDPKEAQILAKGTTSLSPDELGALVFGDCHIESPTMPVRTLEFPGSDASGARLLAKGVLIDLGGTRLQVAGGDKIYQMPVADSAIIACELHRFEVEQWAEAIKSPMRFLKTVLSLEGEDVIQVWGKKTCRQSKPETDPQEVDAIFVMLRIRSQVLDPVLKAMLPGVYTTPRRDNGQPDGAFKIVWIQDRTPADLRAIAATVQGCLGIARSKGGYGIRARCSDFVKIKQTLQPEWKPQASTPYEAQLHKRFELHHVHEAAGRAELQSLLNEIPWRAIVLRQKRPRQWVVAAEDDPIRDTILTEHGCVLIVPLPDTVQSQPPKGKGKGKRSNQSWLVGGRPTSSAPAAFQPSPKSCDFTSVQQDVQGPIQSALQGMEAKLEQRFATLKEEAMSTHAILEKDISTMRKEFQDHVEDQKAKTQALHERVGTVESALSEQLAGFMSNLQTTLTQQNSELTGKIQSGHDSLRGELRGHIQTGHDSLRTELTHELRSQISAIRKKTPSPSPSESQDGDKRMKGR